MKYIALTLVLLATPSLVMGASDFWEKRFEKRIIKAEKGDANSQYAVGHMFEKGKGVNLSEGKAFDWYKKAAEQGLKKAEYKVGYLYFIGKGIKRNHKKASKWLRKAADKGSADAQYYLGKIYGNQGTKKGYKSALKWLKKALENGNTSAEAEIAQVKVAMRSISRMQPVTAEPPVVIAKPRLPVLKAATIPKKKRARKKTPAVATKTRKSKAGKHSSREIIVLNKWQTKTKKPAKFLPSAINACLGDGETVICLTRSLDRITAAAKIKYLIETTITFDPDNDKKFSASYRNRVLSVEAAKLADGRTPAIGIKQGWQAKKRQLDCKVTKSNKVVCVRDGRLKLEFTVVK